MAQEKIFIKEAIKRDEVEKFLSKEFFRAGYSHSDIQRTPLSMRITIYANRPGLIIGRGGRNIDRITGILKNKFGFENPQLDIQEIRDPDLDPYIVSKQIANGIGRGINYKRIANLALQRIMESGAVGVAIRISGKIGGEMGRTEKFSAGYLKFAGDPAESLVKKAYATTVVKLGKIGVQVRILTEQPKELIALKKLEEGEIKPEEKVEENGDNKEESTEGNK